MVQTRGKNHTTQCASGSLQLPAALQPYRRALVPGPGVSIYCDRQSPNEWPEHQHAAAQLLIALDAAECHIVWRIGRGRKQRRTLSSGELLVLPSGVRHARRWLREAGMLILYLHHGWLEQFDQTLCARVAVESVQGLTLHDPLIGGLLAMIQVQCDHAARQDAGQLAALGHCLAARVLHGLALHRAGPVKIQRQLGAETMARVCAHVAAYLGERITLAALAREARLSPGHFSCLFKATMRMTPEQYVLRSRLQRAKELIMAGAHTVSQVAHMTGFSDHSHLTVQFRRWFGATPKSHLPRLRTV